MNTGSKRKKRKDHRLQILQRYNKERQRNVLARPGIFPFILVLDNLKAGYNVAKIFRSAEAFSAREIHLINIDVFDPAPAKGAMRKVPARFFENFSESYTCFSERGYHPFVLEPGCEKILPAQKLPEKSAFILGHEEHGFSFDPDDYPQMDCLAIPQHGQIQSLNVSIAASIVMYEYTRQFNP